MCVCVNIKYKMIVEYYRPLESQISCYIQQVYVAAFRGLMVQMKRKIEKEKNWRSRLVPSPVQSFIKRT